MNRLLVAVLVIFGSSTLLYLEFVKGAGPSKVIHHFVSSSHRQIWNVTLPSSEEDFYRLFLQRHFADSEEVYQEYRKRRRDFVGKDPRKVRPWPNGMVMYFWDYFLPTFSCPYTVRRIGSLGDGGKWMCGLELFQKNKQKDRECILYSFGVSRDSSFESEFLKRTNCKVFAYDASVNTMGPEVTMPNPRVQFNKLYITPNGSSTLGGLMKHNGHKWIDFIKMDVESGEFAVFEQIMDEFEILPFSHLNLEIHGDQEGKLFPTVYKMWERFEEKGLRAFKSEINHWPCVRARLYPIYIEYSFINIFGPSRLIPL